MTTDKYHQHQVLLSKVLFHISQNYPKIRIWKNNTGKAVSFDLKRIVNYGFKGSADITGISDKGIRIEIEIKTGKAVQSTSQKSFMKMITERGGIYLLCHEDDYKEVIDSVFRI